VEIIDAQIHEVKRRRCCLHPKSTCDVAVARHLDRFAGAFTFNYDAEDIAKQVANLPKGPGILAGRNLLGNAATAELRPEFHAGRF
jgi:hypothetical protein